MQDVQKRAPGYGSKWFGMLLAIVVTCVSVIPTIQIAHAYDSGVCNAGTRLCDQGQAYLSAIKEGNEAICIGEGSLAAVNTHASLVLDLAYAQRYQAVVQCYRAFDNYTGESGLGESFYPLKCSARPTFTPAAGSTGNLCQEGCEYTVSNNGGQPVATPNGAVCSPPPPLDPGKNNGCCDGSTGPTTAGNPANVFTGTKLETAADYRAPAGHLEFIRYYSSAVGLQPTSVLGNTWRHSYVRTITVADASTLILTRPNGNFYTFKKSANGTWTPDWDVRETLSEVQDNGTLTGWQVTAIDDSKEQFDLDGKLTGISYTDGEQLTLTYAGRQLQSVTDTRGRRLLFAYQAGRIAQIGLPDGMVLAYGYDPQARLRSVTLQTAAGAVASAIAGYDYGDARFPDALTTHRDEQGQVYASWSYDAQQRVVRSVHGDPAGKIDEATIAYSGNTSTVSNALGNAVTRTGISKLGQAKVTAVQGLCPECTVGAFQSRSYDGNGYPDQEVDFAGVATDWRYNNRALLASKIEAANSSSGQKRTLQTDWHPSFRVPTDRRTYDANDVLVARTGWTYNTRGQALTVSRTDPSGGPTRVTTQRYCEDSDVAAGNCPLPGLMLASDGPRTDIADSTSYSYYLADDASCAASPSSCPHHKGDLWKITNALGQTTEYLAYDGAGRPLSVKDANGIVTDYSYHPRGWLTATKVRGTDASSEADDRITRIDYWPTGLVKQVTQPDGAFTAFTYDTAHRLTDIADNAGNRVHYTLDNAGNRVKEDTRDASGTLKRTLSRIYNQLSQLKTQATAAGDPTDFAYDANGNTTSVTDALGTATQSDYDPLNRLSQTLQDVAGIKAGTRFDYDAQDNLTKVTDPKGLDTTYDYNGFGDLVKLTSPDTGVTSYTYDSAGNRASRTDARVTTTGYGYDALNRLTKVTYPTTNLNVTYTYDVTQTACGSGETFSVGRLTRMQDGGAITQYCYNRFGDLVRKVQSTNGKALVLRYDYTVGGRLQRMTYPDGAVVDYLRNALGQITEVGVTPAGGNRQVLLGNASYYPFGPAAGWTYGNGRRLARRYDLDYRPQAIQDTRPGGLDVGFGFDPAGNLTALTPAGNTTPEVGLRYDALGRLTTFTDGTTGTVIDGYSYDATGNRLSAKVGTTTQPYTYPTDSHRLSAVAGVARSYDATGNTTAIGGNTRQYVYDSNGRMSQARRAGVVTMNYRYNGRGEQVQRFLGTTNTYTLYDEAGHWLGDYDTNGAPKQQAIWLNDLPVGLLANANKLHYIEPDHLGSPRVVIDPTRDVAVWTWSLKGEAFGNTAPDQDPDGDGAALVLDMRFPGQRFDAASGLNQNYFRDYEAATGRYRQSDPIGLNGGFSTFSYLISTHFQR
ncbi:type IV secretion protein Rhs [Xanthomonas oryzae pv. oryzae]|uniref:RHS repeat-associated core domain-containing protein n=1 Tax=Xanthomonas oryzae TaxID=347 RepID=UPI000DDA53C8|nr:RHS repeat-associated core domain-containing protein [Xanthomonas oryzae]RBB43357.1 type IV secretion protein Rhs [Xanthomonas oryzae pv. oryzae]RBB56562.1 type IV secretion protein Rhs [Xanthomonas oryzae pv. oryzae]RBK34530.1 type IV secretion protein Rhs [Xanthomonas oryzae pv. oryzae]RBK48622.1 type IV secretion protein Rhs [Xanthomonas oryzae pv. oryzae]RBK75417.1 type IV secretion protein Rhs [Xanthomonas oryzae pv. oryzae]